MLIMQCRSNPWLQGSCCRVEKYGSLRHIVIIHMLDNHNVLLNGVPTYALYLEVTISILPPLTNFTFGSPCLFHGEQGLQLLVGWTSGIFQVASEMKIFLMGKVALELT